MEKEKDVNRGRASSSGPQRLCEALKSRCQSCDYRFEKEDKKLEACPVCETSREVCGGWAVTGSSKCRHHRSKQGRPRKLINLILKEDHRELVLRCIEEGQTMKLREEYFALKELVFPQMLAMVGSLEDGNFNAKIALDLVRLVEKLSLIQERILRQETSQEVMDFYLSQEKLIEEFQRQLEQTQKETAVTVLKKVIGYFDPGGELGLVEKLPPAMRLLWEERNQMLIEGTEISTDC